MDSCLQYWVGDQVGDQVEAHTSGPLAILEVSKVHLIEHSNGVVDSQLYSIL
jgi:hypothetical protein